MRLLNDESVISTRGSISIKMAGNHRRDASRRDFVEKMKMRRPSTDEKKLLAALVERCERPDLLENFIDIAWVEDMDDGGMGSLKLHVTEVPDATRRMKSQAAELQFHDVDGVVVVASLNLAQDGYPFELDIWKTTFEPLFAIPCEFNDVIQ